MRRVIALAEAQGGRLTTAQLRRCGMSEAGIWRRMRDGHLLRISHGLYALGHRAPHPQSALFDALLLAGPGAALSHATSAWWRGLIRFAPLTIHVSAPGRRGSRRDVAIHHPADVQHVWHRGLPVTPVARTLLDAAPQISFAGVRRMLAKADHDGLITLEEVAELCHCRRAGSAILRRAFAVHMPELALTRSPLEVLFLMFCEEHSIELPLPNFEIAGHEVDAVWPDRGVAVELDGRTVHGTPAAVVRDRRRELAIRGAGYELLRYGPEQLELEAAATAADLGTALRRGRRT